MGGGLGCQFQVALLASPVKWLPLGNPPTAGAQGGCRALLRVGGLMLALGMALQLQVVIGAVGGLVHQPLMAAQGTAGMVAEVEAGPRAVAGVAAEAG